MLGGVFTIIGLLAFMAAICEICIREPERKRRERAAMLERLHGYPPAADRVCAWPTFEPEVQSLRDRGAL